jgi:cyclophilin family peptidyl-prolyl cis-trans isomerase
MYRLILLFLLLQPAWAENTKFVNPQVSLETEKGEIIIELLPNQAPITVDNFIKLINDHHYDGLIFHRVIKNFMIQTGGFTFDFTPKESNRSSIINESANGLKNQRGTIAMARTNDPNSARAQIFINHKDNDFLDTKGNKIGYTVFGRVISGIKTVDKIAQVPTRNFGQYQNVPVDPIQIIQATLIRTGSWTPLIEPESEKLSFERPKPLN